MEYLDINALKGNTPVSIEIDKESDIITFSLSNGNVVSFYHIQDYGETVRIDDIVGNINDLLNNPLLVAEVAFENENLTGIDSSTWTFYKFATIKGYVDIKWYGESNGRYSEKVDMSVEDKEGNFIHIP